ncbi:hypothetical protein K7G98_36085, partial [Saccharothrix sp. MB29]|nr:hypothetical protein [Saccharothrix sp. MB29]
MARHRAADPVRAAGPALIWKWMYDPGPGLLNTALRGLGLEGAAWLDSADTSMLSLVVVATWANLGTATLVYLAAQHGPEPGQRVGRGHVDRQLHRPRADRDDERVPEVPAEVHQVPRLGVGARHPRLGQD